MIMSSSFLFQNTGEIVLKSGQSVLLFFFMGVNFGEDMKYHLKFVIPSIPLSNFLGLDCKWFLIIFNAFEESN